MSSSLPLPPFLSIYLWSDLSQAQQRNLIHQMLHSFEKPWADPELLLCRFLRPSCHVALYITEGSVKGVALFWKEPAFFYLDKFFIVAAHKQQRMGFPFLTALLSVTPSLLWRTDHNLATRFYGRHPNVQTLGVHGEYVYQYASCPSFHRPSFHRPSFHRPSFHRPSFHRPWEYEDIAPLLQMKSAFQQRDTT